MVTLQHAYITWVTDELFDQIYLRGIQVYND